MDQRTKDEIFVRLHQIREILEQKRTSVLERKFALLHVETLLKILDEEC